jgi:predicted ABC-type transport system involved in lysophospholipase L1 biosynthesis ATPase subunit
MHGAAISVTSLGHRFRTSDGDLVVLDALDLDVPAGGYVAIMGSSGAGKSTLLSVLGGLESPQAGEVVVGGTDLRHLKRSELAAFRRATVGFVFQHFGLLDTLSALENVSLARGLGGERARRSRRRAAELLELVGLAHRLTHTPAHLSGGERQRVAIARALANEPRLVLADEPTGNLDEDSSDRVIELLERLPSQQGCTLVIVTHDRRVAHRATRCFRLRDGRLAPEVV